MNAIDPGWRRVFAEQLRTRARIERLAFCLGVKFDPNRPRKPAGQSDGGQWAKVDGPVLAQARGPRPPPGGRRGLSRDRDRGLEAICDAQLVRDRGVCAQIEPPPRALLCEGQAMERYVACLYGRPIPPFPYASELR